MIVLGKTMPNNIERIYQRIREQAHAIILINGSNEGTGSMCQTRANTFDIFLLQLCPLSASILVKITPTHFVNQYRKQIVCLKNIIEALSILLNHIN